ncbi:MAG: T9SS type A sorting domain-containing protein [Candidatus Cloacimonetes bacterium]|nr:T9SS type A sorting domain-containing protein [Candidatus Cloacimonadota bacterium]
MRKSILIALMLSIGVLLTGSMGAIPVSGEVTGVTLTEESDNNLGLSVNINEVDFFDVSTQAGEFVNLSIAGFTSTNEIGAPRLPKVRRIFSVPVGAEVSVRVNDFQIEQYELGAYGISNQVMPSQPPLSKSETAADVEFIYDPAIYSQNSFTEMELANVEELGILRGLRLFVVNINPVRYNPVTNEIQVYTAIDLNIEYTGGDALATAELRSRTWSPVFEPIYAQKVINYHRYEMRDDLTRYPIKYVIISDRMFEDQLADFIDWKTTQGYDVIVSYTDEIGSTTSLIHSYIEGLWDEASPEDPAPSFILFVGDTQQIPAYNGSEGSHVTDLNYVRLEGTDFMPEIYYGRFSAQNTAQLQPQIDKTLEYEMYAMEDPSYLNEVVMIAGMDASHGSTWGNGQINYGTTYYFNEAHGLTSHTYLYPDSGNNAANIVQDVSDGVSYINYTAHGSQDSWADPSFTISNVNSLENEGEYCFAVANCCLTNKFEVGTCFGEAWLRAENKGAIGYVGGTNSTYWDQDYWWGVGAGAVVTNPTYETTGAGAYDGMWHDHDEEFLQWYTVGFAYIMAGNLAVVEGGSMMNYYWEIYALMGDPSLSVFFSEAEENEAEYPEELLLGLNSMEITCEPYSYVALTYDGEIMGVGLVDDSGVLNLEYLPFDEPCMANLTITGQNLMPIITQVQVIPNEGAYLILDAYEVMSGGDDVIDGGESTSISLDVENLGMEDAEETVMTIGCADEYITLEETSLNLGLIPAQTLMEFTELINFEVSEDIPFGHPIRMDLEFTTESGTWLEELNLSAYAPPGLWIDPGMIEAEVDSTETYTTTFAISNYLDDPVAYSIRTESDDRGRDLTNSYMECDHHHFEPGEQYQWIVTVYNLTPDGEWISDVSVSLPEGVFVENTGLMIGGSGGAMEPDVTSGDGITITWHGATPSGYGYLHEGQSAEAVIVLTVDEAYTGYIVCDYELTGDNYGAAPHVINGSFELSYPLSWISLDNTEGELEYGQTDFIEVSLNPEGMEAGTYECEIVITDSRLETRIPVTMEIMGTNENDGGITGLTALYGNYPNPFNPETTISYSLEQAGAVVLEIFNIKGQKVATLVNSQQSTGAHQITWQGEDAMGTAVGSGIYLYRLQTGDQSFAGKMMLMK